MGGDSRGYHRTSACGKRARSQPGIGQRRDRERAGDDRRQGCARPALCANQPCRRGLLWCSSCEHPIAMPGDKASIVTSTKVSIRDPNGKPQYLLTVTEDRTQRKRDEARIEHMAHHDPLTDLSNRTAFNECLDTTLEQAAATGETFAVLCLDLDRFKEVNDVFGHAVGDELLRQIARRLEASCEGAFLARLGGDEFTVITAVGPQPATAEAISERISGALAKDIEIDGHSLRAHLTTGVSIYPNDGTDAI